MLKVLYLVPNLADAAVARRIEMMRTGGAQVAVAGFRRADTAVPDLDVSAYFELGETFDARFVQRIMAVIRAHGTLTRRAGGLGVPDVIVARNLEMLSLASRMQTLWPSRPPIVYECLDIHRLLLRGDVVGHALRSAERHWAKKASLLVTSSPAFLTNYFDIHGSPPALVVENKVLFEHGQRGINPALTPSPATPLRIGWFGALRCSKSLTALAQFSNAMAGRVQVILRGRPALTEFDDFHGFVAAQPHLSFAGPYNNPGDLAAIYSDVHLAWAIDFFEEGHNSKWLLPNRIYEGSLHGAVPITLDGTETAAFAQRQGIGIALSDITQPSLMSNIATLGPQKLSELASAVASRNPSHFAYGAADCRAFVARLQRLCDPKPNLTEAA